MTKNLKIQIAREFRSHPTKTERIMWNVLRGNNFLNLGFRRQHVIEGFIVDFYCHQLKLVIEIDGEIHQNQIKEDKERQQIIEKTGVRFFRIKARDLEEDLNKVLGGLESFICNKLPPPRPSPTLRAGEGDFVGGVEEER